MKLFIDNIPTLVTEVTLVSPIPTMLCPQAVFSMRPKVVTDIAAESEEKKSQRDELTRKLKVLDAGLRICRLYAAREKSGQ